jgi:hypothetical protein
MPAEAALSKPFATPNPVFARPADDETIERTAEALRGKGYDVMVVGDRARAKAQILGLIAEGAEVGSGASKTLDELGVTAEIEDSGRYDALRPKLLAMDQATQWREMRQLTAAPHIWLNSAHALTEDGSLLVASASGSQLGPLALAADRVIFAIGAQKIVPDLATALRRIEEYSYPLEDLRAHEAYGMRSAVNKILIMSGDWQPERISVVLIRDVIGF